MIEINRIHQGDAFDLLGEVDDGAVDLVVCDGPYGITPNEWDRVGNIQEFNLDLIRIFSAKLKELCTSLASRTALTSLTTVPI